MSDLPPAEPDPPPVEPAPLSRPALLYQEWRSVIFAHWEVDPDEVAERLPDGTRPDLLDGKAYVGVVALLIPTTRVLGRVPIGAAAEVNTRIYSIDSAGRRGTVFLSMDVSRPDMAVAGRILGWLPYTWSAIDMSPAAGASGAGFRCRRRLPARDVDTLLDVRPTGFIKKPSRIEQFVTARWFIHQHHPLGTYCLPVTHRRWPLHRAELVHGDDTLVRAAGLTPGSGQPEPMSLLWSPGVDATAGSPAMKT
jgi:uncharacterized protein